MVLVSCACVCHLLWNMCHKMTVFWFCDLKSDLLRTHVEKTQHLVPKENAH